MAEPESGVETPERARSRIARYVTGFAAVLACWTTSAAAQGALERMMPRLERAMAEHRVFLICASLDKAWAADTRETWDEVRGTGRTWLKASGAGADELARFETMTAPERLLVDMPLFRAIELCTVAHPDWVERFTGFRFIAKLDGTPPPAD